MTWAVLVRVLAGIGLVAYPVLVYVGLLHFSARTAALGLLAVFAPLAFLRLRRAGRAAVRGLAGVPLAVAAILLAGAVLDEAGAILAVPVAVNGVLLVAFGLTLRTEQPMIERFARLTEATLSDAQRSWCRLWTRLWCGFFVVNGLLALGLALWAPLFWWTTYNGLIAYVLMGALFGTEYLLRRRRFHGKERV